MKLIAALVVLISLGSNFGHAEKNKPDSKEVYFTATGKAEGTGLPLIFRVFEPGKSVKKSDYAQMVVGTWKYDPKVRNGMPDKQTNEEQIKFENMLAVTTPEGMGYLALVVTGNGEKQWYWYAKDMAAWKKQFKAIFLDKPIFPITFDFGHEPNWETQGKITSSVKKSNPKK